MIVCCVVFFFQAEDGIRDLVRSRGLGDVYKRQHLARVMETGCFTDAKMFRVLEEDTTDGITYAMQYLSLIHI